MNKELTFNLEFAKRMIKDEGHLSAMVIGITDNGDHFICPFITHNDTEKYALAQLIKAEFRNKLVTAIIFMTEAWMVEVRHRALINKDMPRPSENPNRKECIMISYINKDGNIGITVPILRIDNEIEFGDYSESNHIKDKLWGDMFK
jgi:hypothetical protein